MNKSYSELICAGMSHCQRHFFSLILSWFIATSWALLHWCRCEWILGWHVKFNCSIRISASHWVCSSITSDVSNWMERVTLSCNVKCALTRGSYKSFWLCHHERLLPNYLWSSITLGIPVWLISNIRNFIFTWARILVWFIIIFCSMTTC